MGYTPSILYPLFTSTHHMAHPPLTLPHYSSAQHSLSVLPIHPPLYHPTLNPFLQLVALSTSPFYTPYLTPTSFHMTSSLLTLPLYTSHLSSSLLSCFQQLVQLNFHWASHWTQDNPPNII